MIGVVSCNAENKFVKSAIEELRSVVYLDDPLWEWDLYVVLI